MRVEIYELVINLNGNYKGVEQVTVEIKGFQIKQIVEGNDTCEAYEVYTPNGKLLFSTMDREEALEFIDDLSDKHYLRQNQSGR